MYSVQEYIHKSTHVYIYITADRSIHYKDFQILNSVSSPYGIGCLGLLHSYLYIKRLSFEPFWLAKL